MEYHEQRPTSPGMEKILKDFYASDDESVNVSVSSKRRQHQQPQSNPAAKNNAFLPLMKKGLVAEKINDKHFAGDMIRRTVFNDKDENQRPSNASIADNEISARTSNRQMKGLQHTQSMQAIIHQVMVVHNTVTGSLIFLAH